MYTIDESFKFIQIINKICSNEKKNSSLSNLFYLDQLQFVIDMFFETSPKIVPFVSLTSSLWNIEPNFNHLLNHRHFLKTLTAANVECSSDPIINNNIIKFTNIFKMIFLFLPLDTHRHLLLAVNFPIDNPFQMIFRFTINYL